MAYLARSAASDSGLPQSYLDHVLHVLVRGRCYLRKVLRYARDWDSATIQRILELAAEYHDLGKLDEENQSVLAGEKRASRLPVPHADAGVAHLIGQDAWNAALLVYAHHAGLPDIGEINVRGLRNTSVEQRVDRNLPELLRRHETSVRPFISSKSTTDVVPLRPADFRVLFSCLAHADHGDAARASHQEQRRIKAPKLHAAERLEALQRYVEGLTSNGEKSARNRLRSEFFETCANGMCNAAITVCDAPVGTGKTTAVMSHLLSVAAQRGLRRIFVVLPFTNIITQSVQTYRKALTLAGENAEDVVAEIHHRADFENLSSRKLTALWDAPIVVTTAVAFFETLAASSPATLRRFQNLPGSAIFLDEAHAMLPVKLLPLAWHWIQYAASAWSCHWVLASGSLCHFWTLEEFSEADVCCLPNILPLEQRQKLDGFELARAQYHYHPESMTLDTLASWLYGLEGPIIVVLNTVHTAAAAARAAERIFGEGNVLHLSTSLTPKDREITLNLVKERLRHRTHLRWCLVATSCVEAGVDLSFRTGVRECASLLSVLQLAGRVNRNSEYGEANTDVWTITLNANDCGVTGNPSLFCSARILREFFEQGKEIAPTLCTEAMQKEICEQGVFSTRMLDEESRYAFATIAKEFKVIEDDSQLTVINPDLVRRIREFEDVTWQEIQNGSVRIRKNIREKLKIEESRRYPGVLLWPTGAKYTPFIGYMEAVLELEEFDKNGGAII